MVSYSACIPVTERSIVLRLFPIKETVPSTIANRSLLILETFCLSDDKSPCKPYLLKLLFTEIKELAECCNLFTVCNFADLISSGFSALLSSAYFAGSHIHVCLSWPGLLP